MAEWTFLTHHARVLLLIADDPGARLRDIAASLDITERSAFSILADLVEAGYVVKEKNGRRNRYHVQAHLPLPEPDARQRTVGEILALLAGAGPPATGRRAGPPPEAAAPPPEAGPASPPPDARAARRDNPAGLPLRLRRGLPAAEQPRQPGRPLGSALRMARAAVARRDAAHHLVNVLTAAGPGGLTADPAFHCSAHRASFRAAGSGRESCYSIPLGV